MDTVYFKIPTCKYSPETLWQPKLKSFISAFINCLDEFSKHAVSSVLFNDDPSHLAAAIQQRPAYAGNSKDSQFLASDVNDSLASVTLGFLKNRLQYWLNKISNCLKIGFYTFLTCWKYFDIAPKLHFHYYRSLLVFNSVYWRYLIMNWYRNKFHLNDFYPFWYELLEINRREIYE